MYLSRNTVTRYFKCPETPPKVVEALQLVLCGHSLKMLHVVVHYSRDCLFIADMRWGEISPQMPGTQALELMWVLDEGVYRHIRLLVVKEKTVFPTSHKTMHAKYHAFFQLLCMVLEPFLNLFSLWYCSDTQLASPLFGCLFYCFFVALLWHACQTALLSLAVCFTVSMLLLLWHIRLSGYLSLCFSFNCRAGTVFNKEQACVS